jgi:uncharacterized membrane protein (DUF373 family)
MPAGRRLRGEPRAENEEDGGWGQVAFMWSEQVIYGIAAAILVAGALALLVDAIVGFVDDIGDDVVTAATELLSVLLLVFVFVELLGAVRVTLRERRLIAEPFLLVGIIASIKEIVVVAGAERPAEQEEWRGFVEAMIEIGVLAAVILVLAISTLLLRRKEREPSEESA